MTSKVTAILLSFNQGHEHSLTEIARLCRLPISTAHRLTTELTARRLLERTEEGLYRAGSALRRIGAIGGFPPSIPQRAPWVLDDLAAATKTLARLGVLDGLAVSYIEKRPGPRPVTSFTTSATLPAHPTALGRALLAFSPTAAVEMTILQGLRAYTPRTITSPVRLRRALSVTRLTRVAITRGEFEAEISTVAIPVFGSAGAVIAAVEVAVTDLDVELQPVMAALAIAARSLSRELCGNTASDPGRNAAGGRDT